MAFSVAFSNTVSSWKEYDEKLFYEAFEIVHEEYKNTLPEAVELVFISDKEMKEYNSTYRNKPSTTDVLSFRLSDELGQVLISITQAEKQAEKFQHSLFEEIQFLFVHGVLHLAGYEDDTEEKHDEMMKIADHLIKLVQAKRSE